MFCSRCGSDLRGTEGQFCPKCGKRKSDEESTPASQQGASSAPQQGAPSAPQGYSNQTAANAGAMGGAQASYGQDPYGAAITLTVMEGITRHAEQVISLENNGVYSLGSAPDNSIVIRSQLVASYHALLEVRDGQCILSVANPGLGIFYNQMAQDSLLVSSGDVVCMGNQVDQSVVVAFGDANTHWSLYSLEDRYEIRIGREPGNDFGVGETDLSNNHARLVLGQDGYWYLEDLESRVGTFLDSKSVYDPTPLYYGARIMTGGGKFVFLGNGLMHLTRRLGMEVHAEGLVRYRGRGRKRRVTTDHVSVHIRKGEFVAIVGGSGSGKSTLLNEISGWEPADEGSVFVDGVDLYANYDVMRNVIGYVPQEDIVHDNLVLEEMVDYAARLRLPSDTSKDDRRARVDDVLKKLDLDHVRKNYVGNLSGGQKKRASIAVELLAEPRLIFLDEPTSGLDPGTEEDVMMLLRTMADEGRTVVLVTHVTTNLNLCDRVIILGQGGKLCYFGPSDAAAAYFGERKFVKVYDKIAEQPDMWKQRCLEETAKIGPEPRMPITQVTREKGHKPPVEVQFKTLAARYAKLIINDHSRLILLLLQAPLLAALIAWVAGKDCFAIYENTKSCLFALSCAAFWVGILDSIQEICKERDIFRREYDGGMRLPSYVASKVVVLGVLCLVQSTAMTAAFCATIPEAMSIGVVSGPLELFVSLFLVTLSAMCLGLLASALFSNADRAIAMAPLLIMPQILFSGVVVELEGIVETVSSVVNCRWGMSALGSVADLNSLKLRAEEELSDLPVGDLSKLRPKIDATMFDPAMFNIVSAWSVLLVICILCVLGCFGFLWMGTRRK